MGYDNAVVKDDQINRKTLNSFITYQIVKFRQSLDVQEKAITEGWKKINPDKPLLSRLMRNIQANGEQMFPMISLMNV